MPPSPVPLPSSPASGAAMACERILLVLNKVEDERAKHDKLTAQIRASLDLQGADALCLRSFVRSKGPTKGEFVELTDAMLAGVDGRRST